MKQEAVHGLKLSFPESFGVMDREELKTAYQNEHPDRWGIWDKEQHLMVTVIWHESPALLIWLFGDVKSVAKSTEFKVRHSLKGRSYSFEGYYDTSVCGKKARGFRYRYNMEGIEQIGEMVVWIQKNCCYTFCYYARTENEEICHKRFEELLQGIELE